MKKISIILLVFAIMLGFYSCQKEAPKVVFNPANVKAPNLSGITDGSVITFAKSQADSVVQFTWSPAEYGFNTSVQYFLQIAKAGTNFAEPQSLGTTESIDTLSVVVSNFNNKVNTMKANAESTDPVDVEMRLIAIINPNVDTVFSQTVSFTLNTYYIPIVYPQLYVPGD
ncbi:MAG: SusE domain-containing protein, partial [Bacteroidales bacterium]|nr:SusE domain-containing protein [Bacteroidales bacterium]